MEGAGTRLLTKAGYARHRGCSPSMVSKLIRQRKLTPPALQPDGLVDYELADQQLKAVLDPGKVVTAAMRRGLPVQADRPGEFRGEEKIPGQPGLEFDQSGGGAATSRARREAAQAAIAELQLDKLRGDLVEMSAVQDAMTEIGMLVGQQLDARRATLAQKLLGITTLQEVLAIIEAADRDFRGGLAAAAGRRVEAVASGG